jgi:hypothetical protein
LGEPPWYRRADKNRFPPSRQKERVRTLVELLTFPREETAQVLKRDDCNRRAHVLRPINKSFRHIEARCRPRRSYASDLHLGLDGADKAKLRQSGNAVIETDFFGDLAVLKAQNSRPGEAHLPTRCCRQ